jgi:hypothetical protein
MLGTLSNSVRYRLHVTVKSCVKPDLYAFSQVGDEFVAVLGAYVCRGFGRNEG